MYMVLRIAEMAICLLQAPVITSLPDEKSSAVVLGSSMRTVIAACRHFAYDVSSVCVSLVSTTVCALKYHLCIKHRFLHSVVFLTEYTCVGASTAAQRVGASVCKGTYKAFFVVGTVGDAPGDHVQVDFVIVGLNVDRGDHVVGGGRGVVFVGAEFLAHVLVVEAVQQACQALVL